MNVWKLAFCVIPYLLFGLEGLFLRVALSTTRHSRLPGRDGARPSPWRRTDWPRVLLAVLGLLGASKFIGFELLGGDAFNPEFPTWLLFAWGWLESCVWIAFPLTVFGAIAAGVARPCRRGIAWTVVAVSAVLAGYGMWEGMRVPRVVERTVVCEGLPRAFDGYRIVQLSDLHCSSAARRDKIAEIVSRANACQADLAVITGDFVDGTPARRARDLEPLADLRAKDGVWACMGNHERYWGPLGWAPFYRKWNVHMLRNAWTPIRRGEDLLVLGGMDDAVFGTRCEQVFDHAPEDGFRVLLAHRPVHCEANDRDQRVALQLSGHTHGGAMPIVSALVARFNEGHVRGFYRIGNLTLFVSPGSGQWAGFPLRIFNPPEITVLILAHSERVPQRQ